MTVEDYVDALDRHYLRGFLPAGGAAVKVVVAGDDSTASRFAASLQQRCPAGAVTVEVSAESTRVHMVDQLYVELARAVDWDGVAGRLLREAYDAAAFPVEVGAPLVAQDVARHHDVDPRELYRSVRRQLERSLLGDDALTPAMRRAVLRLGLAQLDPAEVDDTDRASVLAWLRGELRTISTVRDALIFARIGRQNARTMVASTARLLHRTGVPLLLVQLDLRRLAESRRPPLEQREGIYYSRAAVLDAYEVLRQFIDGVDDLSGLLLVAVIPPSLMTDEGRGVPAYSALHLRIADEVRDQRRANPFAALVRLDVRLEAVR